MMLQPSSNFESWPEGSQGRKDAFVKAKGWIEIMKTVGTDILQVGPPSLILTKRPANITNKVGSSDTPSISKDCQLAASDLRQLADLLSPHNFRLAYEPWAWSTMPQPGKQPTRP
jgi:hypothetical protein